ncbi:MAG: hypothetical protein KF889_04835 [Alphaproteobacteria bacterium]|nr:hypothetical protein [Alphaproteobacteria bacterium]MCW5742194.1 hypothetical protein [Alphaproteobacteria bacterium]
MKLRECVAEADRLGWELIERHQASTGSFYLEFRFREGFTTERFRVSDHEAGHRDGGEVRVSGFANVLDHLRSRTR